MSFSLCSPPRASGSQSIFHQSAHHQFPVQCIFYSTSPLIFIARPRLSHLAPFVGWVVVFWSEQVHRQFSWENRFFLLLSVFVNPLLVGLPEGVGRRKTFNLIWGTLFLLPYRAHAVRDSLEGFVIIEFWESVILLQSLPGFSTHPIWTFLSGFPQYSLHRWCNRRYHWKRDCSTTACSSHKLESLTLIFTHRTENRSTVTGDWFKI